MSGRQGSDGAVCVFTTLTSLSVSSCHSPVFRLLHSGETIHNLSLSNTPYNSI